ncbi:ribonuclease H-like domain-containing protein, partial [Tanacetum coccineum]
MGVTQLDMTSQRSVNVEETSSKSMLAIDEAGFDRSYMTDNEVPTNMALMAFSDSKFNKSEFNLATYKRGLASVKEQLVFYEKKGIKREFSVARTPQQNGIAERRNRT